MDRFIDKQDFSKSLNAVHLKSSMDRFIVNYIVKSIH